MSFEREKEVFLGAEGRSGEELARYLDEACGGDAELRAEVEALLAADERMSGAFDPPDVEIEGFRIVRQIGAGGMGVVFEAEQLQPARRVALKVLRFGLSSEELKARFRYESETLGRLDHPGIARIYAAGVAGDLPWFAMELVDGVTLHEHVGALDARARLRLFTSICEAVQHAHRLGIVHRDLKPTNILVDSAGRPRLLDFGIAKSEAQQASLATRAGELLGTVPYMSPEQVQGDPSAVDVRSDVYALGVILHELLANRRPLELDGLPLVEALLAVRSREPAALGTLDTRWRGDLETIVAKALEKDPARRYENAGALGADVERHLAHEPILARPPTTTYQLRKFVRRNRALVGGVAATMLVLVGGIVATTIYALEADRQRGRFERERDEARRQQQRAEAARADAVVKARTTNEALGFVTDIFYTGDPAGTRDVPPIPQLLARAAERLADLDLEPAALVQVTHTVGFIQFNLGEFESAERMFARAVELARTIPGSERLPHGLLHLGRVRSALHRHEEARAAFDEALSLLDADESARRAAVLNSRGNDAYVARDLEAAATDFEAALRIRGEGDSASAAHLGLARIAMERNAQDRALEHLDAARREIIAAKGEDCLDLRPILATRASVLARTGKADEALLALKELIAVETARLGKEHVTVFLLRNNYATTLMRAGRHAEAAKWMAEVVADAEGRFAPDAPEMIRLSWTLVMARTNAGDTDGLEPLARRVVDAHVKEHGMAHAATQSSIQALAAGLAAQAKDGEAAELCEAAARAAEADPALRPWAVGHYTNAARYFLAAKRPEDAERVALALVTIDGGAPGHRLHARARLALGGLEGAQDAARKALRAAMQAGQPTYEERLLLARISLAAGQKDRARKLAEGALEEASRAAGDDHPATQAARAFLAELENP